VQRLEPAPLLVEPFELVLLGVWQPVSEVSPQARHTRCVMVHQRPVEVEQHRLQRHHRLTRA